MNKLNLSATVIILVFIRGALSLSPSPSQCWVFDASFSQWVNIGWKQAPNDSPDLTNIPTFPAGSTPYYWLQDQSGPSIGTLTSNFEVTINNGDTITATLYRHLINMDGNDRINMSIITSDNIKTLTTQNYDVFDTVSVNCSNTGYVCCSSYPCFAQLKIVGEVAVEDELVAVNHVGINCITPPPPPPAAECCSFNTDVCEWSLLTASSGWHWSIHNTPLIPPPFITAYIWVEDTTANVSSNVINDVDRFTTFEFTYDFVTTNPTLDSAEVWFGLSRIGELAANLGPQTHNFTCLGYECCAGSSSCSGQITVNAQNSPGVFLTLSIDSFCVYR